MFIFIAFNVQFFIYIYMYIYIKNERIISTMEGVILTFWHDKIDFASGADAPELLTLSEIIMILKFVDINTAYFTSVFAVCYYNACLGEMPICVKL